MKPVLILFLATASALAGPKRDKADKMFDELLFDPAAPFSFDVLYGSREAYEAVRAPERLEAYRIDHAVPPEGAGDRKTVLGYPVLSGPVAIEPALKEQLHKLLLNKDSFGLRPPCVPRAGVLMRLISGKMTMDFVFCFECRMVIITANEEPDEIVVWMSPTSFEPFLRAFQAVFPDDASLKGIKTK